MAQAVTRDDIDEVLALIKVFMKQVDERLIEQEKKHGRLLTTFDN